MSNFKSMDPDLDKILFWTNIIIATVFMFFIDKLYFIGIPSCLYITIRCTLGGILAWKKPVSWESIVKFFYFILSPVWVFYDYNNDESEDFTDEKRNFLGRVLEIILGFVYLFRFLYLIM